ncbi:MAG: type II toxin-antitoxin system PemK/MazF family toxin [Candidatus Kapaibacterium sp.]|nr:MAG: type II toxin-antitoxin system PemK/MazF family toxin [Candidatus Kapabacteria bacterium]
MLPKRGEIWLVEFDPQRGAEIAKKRPAVVLSVDSIGHLPLRMVVPCTDWKPEFESYSWFIALQGTASGLRKPSGADAFQCKSFSLDRFVKKLGSVTPSELNEIALAVGLCIGL